MLKVAILGLTGDPITLGHMDIAQSVANSGIVDKVWIQPCWKHRLGKEPIAAEYRLQMAILAAHVLTPDIFSSAFEIDNKFEGGTYLLHQIMQAAFPAIQFYHIIGMDNANDIDKWANSEKLKAEVPFIVCNRKGVEEKETWFKQEPHKRLHHEMAYPISSTEVKEKLKTKDPMIMNFLHVIIHQYIEINNLYQ